MNTIRIGRFVQALALVLGVGMVGTLTINAQSIAGRWTGTRSERNPMNGHNYTVNFVFEFGSDGSYREKASFGNWGILELTGTYQLSRGSRAGDPSVTHILSLRPENVQTAPNDQAKMLLDTACVANTDATNQYVTFFNVAPLGGMSLQNTAGGDTWGINRVQ